jgi:hypothetical protein
VSEENPSCSADALAFLAGGRFLLLSVLGGRMYQLQVLR